jgi:hypothetical protein
MALWDKLRSELDRAGRVAQQALDEGRVRLDAFRARQRADKTAQELGYALYHARQAGRELELEVYTRLSSQIASFEADAGRLEQQLEELRKKRSEVKAVTTT